jgi:dipeptidyl aminopeptidase/acylaminoacyl peptidase
VVTRGATSDVRFDVICAPNVGSLSISIATSGDDVDQGGYLLRADGATDTIVATAGTVVLRALRQGTHVVKLESLPANCAVVGANPAQVLVAYDSTSTLSFSVHCSIVPGIIRAWIYASGVDPDPDGYQLLLQQSGAPAHTIALPVSGTALATIAPGDYSATLGGVAANCGARVDDAQTIHVVRRDTLELVFDIVCTRTTQLAFVTVDGIFLVSSNGTGLRRLSGGQDPSWSPDGARIAFSDGAIYVMTADATDVRRVTEFNARFPSWSPNGTQLAYTSEKDGASEVYVSNGDGSELRQITKWDGENPAPARAPRWSPDGTSIVFWRDSDFGPWFIYQVNPDGSDLHQLAMGRDPAWSPDGKRIAYIDYYVSIIGLDGVGSVRLDACFDYGFFPWLVGGPTWSPDGKWLAFPGTACGGGIDDRHPLTALRVDGKRVAEIVPLNVIAPAWRP